MKILHTADWHLGKKLLEIPLLEDQKVILNQISNLIKEKEIDIFVLAGDIFQNYNISDDVIEVFNHFLEKAVLSNPNTIFIITNGNHDSAEKLNYGSKLMRENLKIITKLNSPKIEPIWVIRNNKRYNFYVIPFIRISDFNQKFPQYKVNNFNDFYKSIIGMIDINPSEFNVLITHTAIQFENYELEKSSEDETYGNVEMVDPEIFKDFNLVLLGHYHKHNKFLSNIYYSGSIYKYSQKEEKHKKGVMIYDLEKQENKFIPLNLPRDLVCINDFYSNILNNYDSYKKNKDDYVYIVLKDLIPIPEIQKDLSNYFSNIVSIEYEQVEKVFGNSKLNLTYDDVKNIKNNLELEFLFEKFLEFLGEESKLKQEFVQVKITKTDLVEKLKEIYKKF